MVKRINKLAFGYYFRFGGKILKDETLITLPQEQHSDYKWFGIKELIQSDEVHKYVKDYFNKIGEDK